MDIAYWEKMQALFHEALDLPASERQSFLEEQCEGDSGLLADILALLEEDQTEHSLLDRDLAHVASGVLDGSVPFLSKIGSYHIKGALGKGSMGVVYLGEHEDLHQQVAIKVLRDASLSPARRERFKREELTLAQLSHPSIARLYHADVLRDGTPYFVMEYVEGVSLTTYCERHKCTIQERLHIFHAVCKAVQYAHRQAIIHRDLKPSNILVARSDSGGEPTVKLLDFGIAKQLEGLGRSAFQTQHDFRLMTTAYAAPEQLRGDPVGVYTDVYALGVILYELLTLRHPAVSSGVNPAQIEGLILRYEPEKPSSVAQKSAGISKETTHTTSPGRQAWADLDVLCLTAMHKDPQRRYATVEALLRDLDHYLKGEPLEARPDSIGYRMGKFLIRNRRSVAALGLGITVVLGLITFYTAQLTQQRNRARAEASKAEQISDYLIGLFEAGDPFAADSDSLDVRTLLERGRERADQLEGQPEAQAQMLDVLGRIHTYISDFDNAGVLLQRALAIRRTLNNNPLDIARSLVNLGVLKNEMAEYDSAEVLLRQALLLRERYLPPGHPDFASNLDALGIVLNRKGEYEEAEALYRLALRLRLDLHDEPHADVAYTLNNLAVNLFDQGEYATAEQYFREALSMDSVVFGPDHPSTAVDLSNLGVFLETQGDFAAADSVLTEALRIKRLALGNDHYEIAFSLTQLGGMLRRKGEYDRAERYLREALEIEGRVFGPDHRNSAVTLNHLALTYQERGDYETARPLLQRSIEIFQDNLGDGHPYTNIVRCHLAYLFHLQGSNADAELIFKESLAALEAALPADHDMLALKRGEYGAMLVAQSRFAEAEPLLVGSHKILDERFGPEHPNTREAARRLVSLYRYWGKHEQAKTYDVITSAETE